MSLDLTQFAHLAGTAVLFAVLTKCVIALGYLNFNSYQRDDIEKEMLRLLTNRALVVLLAAILLAFVACVIGGWWFAVISAIVATVLVTFCARSPS
jgi:hypothetical protein